MKKFPVLVLVLFLCLSSNGCIGSDYRNVIAGVVPMNFGDYIITKTTQFDLSGTLDVSLFKEVLDLVSTAHMDRFHLDTNEISLSMVRGLMQGLDKHSRFYSQKEIQDQYALLGPEMAGSIGCLFEVKKRYVLVTKSFKSSPAEKAGLKRRDKIVEIDGVPIRDFQDLQVIKMLRGKIGTKVSLKIFRHGRRKPFSLSVVRENYIQQKVCCYIVRRFGKKFGVIKIEDFMMNVESQYDKETAVLMKNRPDYIIFDLRDNTGGFVNSVANIMEKITAFLDVIYQVEDSVGNISKRYCHKLVLYGMFGGINSSVKKMVCLVNANTASAAEIMASGLRDILGVKLIGETTYGKGTAWYSYILNSGRGLCNITAYRWLTSKGNSVDGVGLDPDVEVFMDEEDILEGKDPQMDAAIRELLRK